MAEALFPDGVQASDLRPGLERIEIPIRILWRPYPFCRFSR